jgi:hypothetical protein
MASTHKHIRSGTANKRPTTAIADGQIALNTNTTSPGLFFKDSTGATIIKIGPVHVGATAPNATPAAGGSSGNSTGEVWLDNSLTPVGVKIWNGSAWVNATPIGSTTVQGLLELATDAETQAGSDTARAVTPASLQSKVSDSTSTTSSTTIASSTAVKSAYDLANAALPKSGGTITGNLEIGTSGSLSFEGSTADAFETTIAVTNPTADRTITLPDTTGTVVTTGDTGTVTSTMLLDGTIVDGDINASAAIAHSKLANITAGSVLLGNATNVPTATALSGDVTVNSSGVTAISSGVIVDADINASAAIADTKLATIATADKVSLSALNIDGGTDIGAALADADLFIVDDGGAGTNRKAAATRITDYAFGKVSGDITIGSTGTAAIGSGVIVNADVNASAAIAGTKISPDFGSQNIITTGLFSHALGTAGAPTITFTGDTNTGIYSPGADQVAISTAGTGRLFVDSSGRVGIGTSSPGATLDVNGKLRLSSTEDNQLEWVSGAQTWRSNVVSGGKWYLYDVTNAKFPLDVSANTTCKLDINTSHIAFTTSSSERARIDSSGRLLVGTSSARGTYLGAGISAGINLEAAGSLGANNRSISIVNGYSLTTDGDPLIYLGRTRSDSIGGTTIVQNADGLGRLLFLGSDGTNMIAGAHIRGEVDGTPGTNDMPGRLLFSTTADGASSPTERMRISADGTILAQKTTFGLGNEGFQFRPGAGGALTNNQNPALYINRLGTDGVLLAFYQDTNEEGTISVSGTTVSYNGAHLSRWSQLPGNAERTEILRGTVLSNIDEMCEWGEEANEQLNRMKVSDVEGDPNVSGVFQAWDDDDDTYTDDFYCAMTGDFIIRIAEGVMVQRGDLLMSAGDGTAKPQDDDIIRSKTVAKVTSTHVTCTYDDGSYCVPCVLMAC